MSQPIRQFLNHESPGALRPLACFGEGLNSGCPFGVVGGDAGVSRDLLARQGGGAGGRLWSTLFEQGEEAGHGRASGFRAALDQLFSDFEAVPGEAVDLDRDHEVGGAAPFSVGAGLHDLETAIDHLEHVPRVEAVYQGREEHRDDVSCAHGAEGRCGHFHGHRAIHEVPVQVPHGLEQARVRATGADGKQDIARVAKYHGPATAEVGGDDCQRDAHLFEAVDLEKPPEELVHALACGETERVQRPPRYVFEAHRPGDAGDLIRSRTARVRGGNNGAGTHARNHADGHAVFFENAQNADVRDAARKPASKSNADDGFVLTHTGSHPAGMPSTQLLIPDLPKLDEQTTTRAVGDERACRLLLSLMFRLRSKFLVLLLLAVLAGLGHAQENLSGASEIQLGLARLNTVGSALMIGAHPDDEHSDTLAWLARGRSVRTGYLSLTRGEGGQNLIGPEQGDLLGVIRTQELLAARRIDGAEQFFTRAIDFGFSKSVDETFAKWGRERILSDIVWVIRRFRPDVIILCFSGTPRDGHGQHQASATLGKEAFYAAADARRFTEQLKWVEPWQAKRVVWNIYGASEGAGQVRTDTGSFNPVLGYSYAEIAAMSRSQHRSQGMGMAARRGSVPDAFSPVAGEPAVKDLFDGIDTTWGRVQGGGPAGAKLAEALQRFVAEHPERIIPLLLEARRALMPLKDFWAQRKLQELDAVIAHCAGLWLDAPAERWDGVPGSSLRVNPVVIGRLPAVPHLLSVEAGGTADRTDVELPLNEQYSRQFSLAVPDLKDYSQPFWLQLPKQGETYTIPAQTLVGETENPPLWTVAFRLRFGTDEIELKRPVLFRYADRSRGELTRPLGVVPALAVEIASSPVIFPDVREKRVDVLLKSITAVPEGVVRLDVPQGWKVTPRSHKFRASDVGSQITFAFDIAPPAGASRVEARAVATTGEREFSTGLRVIAYPHFPAQAVFPPATADLVRADIRVEARRIGYVMGAGDQIPDSLAQLGCNVTLLTPEALASGDLSGFDAIVTGVRAFNLRADLRANAQRLFDYASAGGTVVVQYNVLDWNAPAGALANLGPYQIRIGRDRVTDENIPVTFPNPQDPLLASPNRITAADFEGWVQERGLYFADSWDPRYKTLLESHDPGEPARPGGTLYTRYGKGAYVFTAYSWFRQLPAGVPGAFRVFANLLSAAKVLE